MRSNRELFEKYADVLERDDDQGLLRVVGRLDAAYAPPRPPPPPSYATIRALAARSASRHERRWLPRWLTGGERGTPPPGRSGTIRAGSGAHPSPLRRNASRAVGAAGLAAFAAVVALIVLGMATALPGMRQGQQLGSPSERIRPARTVAPIGPELRAALDRNFRSSPYTREIMVKGLGEEVSLAQTVDGYTLTMARVYADAKYIWIGLVAEGPEGRPVADIHLRDITDPPSRSINDIADLRLGDDPDSALERGPTQIDNEGLGKAFLLGFETPKLEPGTRALEVRLEVPGLVAREVVNGRSPSSVRYGDGCQEVIPAVRCRAVVGPFTYDFTVPVEPITPEYYDPERDEPIIRTMLAFLDARIRYVNAEDRTVRQEHEERARSLLTLAYSGRVRDIGDLGIPNQTTDEGAPVLGANRAWATDSRSATRASIPVRWEVGGKLVIRRFHLEKVGDEWQIARIEPLRRDPQPWNFLEPEKR